MTNPLYSRQSLTKTNFLTSTVPVCGWIFTYYVCVTETITSSVISLNGPRLIVFLLQIFRNLIVNCLNNYHRIRLLVQWFCISEIYISNLPLIKIPNSFTTQFKSYWWIKCIVNSINGILSITICLLKFSFKKHP